jgi:hypothetical protein
VVHLLSKVDFDLKKNIVILPLELKGSVGIPKKNIQREKGED